MIEQELASVPAYDDLVERNRIEILQKPGDLVLRNGDLAITRWGDLARIIHEGLTGMGQATDSM